MTQNRLLGIANPQNTKGLGHFLTTDCKSVGTTNGILALVLRSKSQSVMPVPADFKSVETPNGRLRKLSPHLYYNPNGLFSFHL